MSTGRGHRVVQYWRSRAKRDAPNAGQALRLVPVHLSYLARNLRGCSSILDYGLGDGRLFAAYRHAQYVVGYDVTDHWRETLVDKAQAAGLRFEFILADEVGPLPFSDQEFAAAVATEVLHHQEPDDIALIMSELTRVARKAVAIVWYEPGGKPSGTISGGQHFHDYPELCQKLGLRIVNQRQYGRQLFLTFQRDENTSG